MYTALREKTIVKTNGVLEIRSPELLEGSRVEIIVIVEPSTNKTDALGWPEGFFDTFAGCLPDLHEPEFEGGLRDS
jgi:hypothetical protein